MTEMHNNTHDSSAACAAKWKLSLLFVNVQYQDSTAKPGGIQCPPSG